MNLNIKKGLKVKPVIFLFSVLIVLSIIFIPSLFAQSDEPSDAVLADLLKQRDVIKAQMEGANEAKDYDKYKQLEVEWNTLSEKISAREELVKSSQKEAKRLLDEASSLRRDRKYAQAQTKYTKLLSLIEFIGEDKEANIKLMIAFCMERQDNYSGAEKTYSEVIQLDPSNASAYSGKARALARMGKDSEAINFYKKAVEIDAKDNQSYFFMAQSYEKIDMLDEAEAKYLKCTEIDPSYYKGWYNLGVLRFRMKKYEAATDALKASVQSDQKNQKEFYKAYTLMAQIYNTIGNYTQAINAAESAVNLKSNYAPAHLEKGIALEKSERYNQAIESFNKCLNDKNCRDSAQWHINLIKEKYLGQGQ